MNRLEKTLKVKMRIGYWSGHTMAMYPNQFAYLPIDVDFERIWSDRKEVNLYYHIPFCKSLCPYCGFFTTSQNDSEYMSLYVDKLNRQMEYYASCFTQTATVKSICFGGGTPNHIPIREYFRIFDTLSKVNVRMDEKIEPSMEVSPELLTEDYVRELQRIGIRRLSLGVQSLNFDIRQTINRKGHYNILSLAEMMRRHNMNINIDVMSGIKGQKPKDFMDTLEQLMIFKPETISIYPLAGKDSSMIKKYDDVMTNKEKYELFRIFKEYLIEQGYYCESNVKFVLENQPSTHQQKIYEYEGVDTMGIGCAARSYNYYTHYTVESRFNDKNRQALLNEYINHDFRQMKYYGIHMNDTERKSRFAVYGAFIGKIDAAKFQKQFLQTIEDAFPEQIEALVNLRLLEKSGENYLLTDEGRVYTDMVCESFRSKELNELFEKIETC